jgi:hypothetical protein
MTQQYYNFIPSYQKPVYKFLNTKRRLLYCNASIAFNKVGLIRKITPKYARINIKPLNTAAKNTYKAGN